MKKILIPSLSFLLLLSCTAPDPWGNKSGKYQESISWKIPKTVKMIDGMGDTSIVKINPLTNEFTEIEFNSIVEEINKNPAGSAIDANPCKHEGSYKPKELQAYKSTYDSSNINVKLTCMCQNSYGVYGEVVVRTILDKNHHVIVDSTLIYSK